MDESFERLYPTGQGWSQVVIATGRRNIFISGQVAVNEHGETVGKNDFIVQAEQIFKNLERGLRESGASFDDLVRMTIYIVDYGPEKRRLLQKVRSRFISEEGGPASTLIGVSALVSEDFLLEIEAQAITT